MKPSKDAQFQSESIGLEFGWLPDEVLNETVALQDNNRLLLAAELSARFEILNFYGKLAAHLGFYTSRAR